MKLCPIAPRSTAFPKAPRQHEPDKEWLDFLKEAEAKTDFTPVRKYRCMAIEQREEKLKLRQEANRRRRMELWNKLKQQHEPI